MSLNGRSYGYLALICLAGILAQWIGAGYLLWRGGLALFVAGLAYEFWIVRNLHLSAKLQDVPKILLGRKVRLTIKFFGDSSYPRPLRFSPGLPPVFSGDRMLREVTSDASVDLEFSALELGEFDWPRLPTQVRGPLGLAWWSRAVELNETLQVQPDIFSGSAQTAGQRPSGSQQTHQGAGIELHHLRDYVPGDPLHAIAWKAAARRGELTTRVFSNEQSLEIVLVVDAGRTSLTEIQGMSQLGHYINLSSRFAQHALQSGDRVGLLSVADRPQQWIPPGQGAAHFKALHETLGQLKPSAVEANLFAAASFLQRRLPRRCLLILLTDLYGGSADGALGRSLQLWRTRHLPMVVSLLDPALQEISQRTAEGSHEVYLKLASDTYQRAVAVNEQITQRHGAQCLVTRPDALEHRVFARYAALKAQRRI